MLKNNIYIYALLFLFCWHNAWGQKRSVTDAMGIAQDFWMKEVKVDGCRFVNVPLSDSETYAKARGIKTNSIGFYVFNDEFNGGFIIISADGRQQGILGYSKNGLFDPDHIPSGLIDLLCQYFEEYEGVQSQNIYSPSTVMLSTQPVEPLIMSQWNQMAPYNNQCPIDPVTNSRCVTGCVATAMAQIMNYYQYPDVGRNQVSYKTTTHGIVQDMDFSTCRFDWRNMSEKYDGYSTEVQKNAIAQLMHACGVSVHMNYTSTESGASVYHAAYALKHYFGYNPYLKFYKRTYFSAEQWDEIIHAELRDGRPILYAGYKSQSDGDYGGHAFVLDGCDQFGNYHFNWGWGGYCDGYFKLSSLTPGYDDWSANQTMICRISKPSLDDDERKTGDGTEDRPFNALGANHYINSLDLGEESSVPIYVKGRVVSIVENYGTKYGNATFVISDDGNIGETFFVYRTLYLGNKKYESGELLKEGDEVLIYGNVTNYLGAIPETVEGKSYVVSINSANGESISEGSLERPFNCVQANNKASELGYGETSAERYYVKGKVSSVVHPYSQSFGTAVFYISDDGTSTNQSQFYVYGAYYLGNKPWVEGDSQINVGDDVIVYGKMANYKGIYEMANKENYVYSHNGQTHTDIDDIKKNEQESVCFSLVGTRSTMKTRGLKIVRQQDGKTRKILF